MTASKIGLIDGDLLVYKCGFAAEERRYVARFGEQEFVSQYKREATEWLANAEAASDSGTKGSISYEPHAEPIENACQNVSTVVRSIKERLAKQDVLRYEFYLSGKGNFRYDIATLQPYKGNRKDVPKPVHYDALREFITDKYRATVVEGEEADDAIGIRAIELHGNGVIVSIDKDLNNIPGPHFDWTKDVWYDVSEVQALRNFYGQMLTGDETDNIPGIYGIGKVKATKLLAKCTSAKAMWFYVLNEWLKAYPDGFNGTDTKKAVIEIGQLLYIRQKKGELWQPP